MVTGVGYDERMAVASYLRVYLPAERVEDLLEHVAEGKRVAPVLTRGEFGLWSESSRDDAFVIEFEGRRYVCPRHARLRMLEGLLAFRNAYGGSPVETLVPEGTAARAADELEHIRHRLPGVRSQILTSPFYVPLRWFAAFDPGERMLVQEDGEVVSILYRTLVRRASRRLRRVAEVLEAVGFEDPVVEQIEDLARWVGAFPGEAVLELDYGSVAMLFTAAELAVDETAAEVAASIDALEEDDFEQAGEHYAVAASRWAHAQSLGHVN